MGPGARGLSPTFHWVYSVLIYNIHYMRRIRDSGDQIYFLGGNLGDKGGERGEFGGFS